jgi:hypothetical protein
MTISIRHYTQTSIVQPSLISSIAGKRPTPHCADTHKRLSIVDEVAVNFIASSARAVCAQWGNLVRSGVIKRDYKEISINNVRTIGTRIRIVVLRVGF